MVITDEVKECVGGYVRVKGGVRNGRKKIKPDIFARLLEGIGAKGVRLRERQQHDVK